MYLPMAAKGAVQTRTWKAMTVASKVPSLPTYVCRFDIAFFTAYLAYQEELTSRYYTTCCVHVSFVAIL
jgi:hypothetical protein